VETQGDVVGKVATLIGELQRLDDSGDTVPSQADIVRKAVARMLAEERKAKRK